MERQRKTKKEKKDREIKTKKGRKDRDRKTKKGRKERNKNTERERKREKVPSAIIGRDVVTSWPNFIKLFTSVIYSCS